jgi:hypothetical protein
MNIRQAIKSNMTAADFIVNGYLADLTPEEMLARPAPGANHTAWQVGHLIASECYLVDKAVPGKAPALPAGFAEKHKKETAGKDNPADFLSKEEYLQIWKDVRNGTLSAVEGLSDADFDKPATGVPPMLKTVGDTLLFIPMHWVMHAGQWAVTRRKLGRAPLF